jgi:hypothetical protein
MNTSLTPPSQWAQTEFGLARLGDQRRTKRLIKIAAGLAQSPGGTLPQAFPDWKELKAAYRFLDQPGVSFEQVLRPHWERTQEACRQPGEYLIIEDTTELSYTGHPAAQDLGVIGDGRGRGFSLHNALAVRVEGWTLDQRPEGTVVGLWEQQCRCPRPASEGESRREQLSRSRKTQCWAAGFKFSGPPPKGSQWIYLADRESDFYEPFQICRQHGIDFLIRACHDRCLSGGAGHLREALQRAPVLGQATVALRARGSQPARTALVELRCVTVGLKGPWRPGGWQSALAGVTGVEAREIDPPEGATEPLHWILLTSLPCATLAQARRIVGRYAARWWIEEYHQALKTGTGVEDSQLERAHRLEVLVAVLALVAVRLLSAKLLARSRPDRFEAAESFGPQMLELLEKKIGVPKSGWTNRQVLVSVARLGGFLGRKHDGLPGWQTIWRGWQRLMWMCEGLAILNNS